MVGRPAGAAIRAPDGAVLRRVIPGPVAGEFIHAGHLLHHGRRVGRKRRSQFRHHMVRKLVALRLCDLGLFAAGEIRGLAGVDRLAARSGLTGKHVDHGRTVRIPCLDFVLAGRGAADFAARGVDVEVLCCSSVFGPSRHAAGIDGDGGFAVALREQGVACGDRVVVAGGDSLSVRACAVIGNSAGNAGELANARGRRAVVLGMGGQGKPERRGECENTALRKACALHGRSVHC